MLMRTRRALLAMAMLTCLSTVANVARAEGKAGDKVCMVKSGKAYHKKGCKAIAKSKNVMETTRGDAEKKGAKACKMCKP